jgi:hypothetical protein
MNKPTGTSQPKDLDHSAPENQEEEKEETLDKTIADSFPASDPPSSIPDPEEEDDAA